MMYDTDFSILNDLCNEFRQTYKTAAIEIFAFPQLWGSTALGYDGFGGSVMTTAYTIALYDKEYNVARVYFGGTRLAYEIKNPNDLFFKDLQRGKLTDQSNAGKYSFDEVSKESEEKNRTFCAECRAGVDYYCRDEDVTTTIMGRKCSYTEKRAICADCGAEVFVPKIEDENLRVFYEAYHGQSN